MKRKIQVTDHAVLRWLERFYEIDVSVIRKQLVDLAQPYASIGVKHAEIGGLWFVFHDNRLVTITPSKPDLCSLVRNDPGPDYEREPMHWKAKKRKRGR